MKISVITMHAVKNYGSVLQTYATQRVLEQKGLNVEFINYIRKKNLDSNLLNTWTKDDNGIKKVIKQAILYPTVLRWKKVFNSYLDKYIKSTKKIYTTEDELIAHPVKADIFCTGSDQVWNSGWNNGLEKPFYLSFVPDDIPKISLASSIGKSELEKKEFDMVLPYLSRYKYISIRELSSVEYLKKMGIKNVNFCLDPTLLLTREEWKNHLVEYNGLPQKYILVYQLNHDTQFDSFAEKLAQKKGIPLYRICTRYDQARLSGKPIFIPQVQQWLSLINNAEIVLTNSFHATAFCINMNTQFVSVNPNEYSCRISDVLKLFGLEKRRLKSYDQLDIADEIIDFKSVNSILERYRKQSLDLIDKMIKDSNFSE